MTLPQQLLSVTVSIGVADRRNIETKSGALLKAADLALKGMGLLP